MDEPVRLGLFGAGGIGARHLGLAGEEPECEIVAVADPREAAAAVAGRHGARFYRDSRELLSASRSTARSSPLRTRTTRMRSGDSAAMPSVP